ncbi:MAG: HpcH/HpaI aldolase family protein [Propionibacteriaceae bacterium]
MSAEFAARVRQRETVVGYWVSLDAPTATERLARVGYDYLVLDAQHGLFGYTGMLAALLAIDAAATPTVGLVRVGVNDPAVVGRALDAGAAGVIVPLVSSVTEAAAAVWAAHYPPGGIRSYGPTRAGLRTGPDPAAADAEVLVLVMIETADGLDRVEEIAATPGLDGLYIGPSDLMLALGGARPDDPERAEDHHAAVTRIRRACETAGIAAGIYTPSGSMARRRIEEGFTFVTVASDLDHLRDAAADHLEVARG